MDPNVIIYVLEDSDVAECRRRAASLARSGGLDATEAGQLSIIVTEAATNLVKHSKGGEILLRAVEQDGRMGVEMLALDKGRGMPDVEASMRDGYSTSGGPGTGLGAIRRLATDFDIYSQPGRGTALLARLWTPAPRTPRSHPPFEVGVVSIRMRGEEVNGDACAVRQTARCCSIVLADGLGHGALAADASLAAVRAFVEDPFLEPAGLLERVHLALRGTRGAAAAIAQLDALDSRVRFAGLGNVAGVIIAPESSRHLVSHNGTAGVVVRKIQEFSYAWSPKALLVLQSDGISTHWAPEAYPGILNRDPSVIAGIIYRDFGRSRDDASVIVVRNWRNHL